MSFFREMTRSAAVSRRLLLVPAALLLVALAPAVARADTHTFLNTEGFGPSEGAGTIGPATHYPGTVAVSGLAGTVTKVTLTVLELSANSDLDMALVGPNGAQVMLMSDACASTSAQRVIWTFDDSAPQFVNSGSCPLGGVISVRPTNYEPESDNLSVSGGPTGPFTNALSAFNGISPNGAWKLFLIDDHAGVVGFEMGAFALTLEVEPPPPAPPTIVTVQAPAPAQVKTGKRAAALSKCKTKKTKKARKGCRQKARKLPL